MCYSIGKKPKQLEGWRALESWICLSSVLSLLTKHGGSTEVFKSYSTNTNGRLIILKHFVPIGLETFSSIVTWLSHRLSDVGTLTGEITGW